MAKALTTALRLMRLLLACWEHPILTLDDIQRVCRDSPDDDISNETAYNYIASLQSLGVTVKKLSRKTWYIEHMPGFPGLCQDQALISIYRQLGGGHPVISRLLGTVETGTAQTCPWLSLIEQRRVCQLQTTNGQVFEAVPLLVDGQLLRYWHLAYDLPLHLPLHQIVQSTPQSATRADLMLPRVIVQFEVLDNLAQRFEPTTNDTVLESSPGRLRIANRCDDATTLCRRLLRYQLQCHVLGPPRFIQLMRDELVWLQHGLAET